ncbi:MAG TPA: peptidyl-prolyl cis-trans isomerase [Syntrophomonadaceae bacterium]|nr:peptidyl-prolyl cis-trans isomerase [Syntrophomonadaceae bacterium]
MRRISYLLLMSILLLVAAGCSSASSKPALVGQVNGQGITQTDYDKMVKLQKALYQLQSGGNLPQDNDTLKQIQDAAFDGLVTEWLFKQEAQKRSITVSDQEVATALDQFKASIDYQKLLTDTGLSEADIKSMIQAELISGKVYEDMGKKSTIGDADIAAYYQAHQADYKTEAGIEIYHILVQTEAEAQDILSKIKNGSDFSQLAKENSLDTASTDQGGFTGIGNADSQWVQEFKDAALKLKPGEMAPQPVKSQFGYHIIKAGKKVEATQKTLDQVKNDILSILQSQKASQALQELRQNSDIKDLRTSK